MRSRVTLQLAREAEAYALAWTCDDCAYFEQERETCTHGYPETARRQPAPLRPGDTVSFCKEFELF